MKVIYLINWVLLFFFYSNVSMAFESILEPLSTPAKSLQQKLSLHKKPTFSSSQRSAMQSSAALMKKRGKCYEALTLQKEALQGNKDINSNEWFRLGRYATCSRQWKMAVNANYLAYQKTTRLDKKTNYLAHIAYAMERSWAHDKEQAMDLYAEVLSRQSVTWVEKRVKNYQDKKQAEALKRSFMKLENSYSSTEGERASICLQFSHETLSADDSMFVDYLRFEPDFQPHFYKNNYNEICAAGAKFSTQYKVKILAGLKSKKNSDSDEGIQNKTAAKVKQHINTTVKIEDRPANIYFKSRRYVMPTSGQGIPLFSVNVDKANLSLYRIDERNLSHDFIKKQFKKDLDWDAVKQIRDKLGHLVWTGTTELLGKKNKELITNLPLVKMAIPKPGIYVLTAENKKAETLEGYEKLFSAQWLLVSNQGMTTYHGKDGLTATIHSLDTAQPLSGVRLKLYAKNNSLLAESSTNDSGMAFFSKHVINQKGGQKPDLLMAYGDNDDFNFFNVQQAPYDLSDRGVGGRQTPANFDIFAYTERGVYRPADKVNLTALLRDHLGVSVKGLPLTIRQFRPDEQLAHESVLHPLGMGGYTTELNLSKTAQIGKWAVRFYVDPKAEPIGETSFQVEAIIPPRISVDLIKTPKQIIVKQKHSLTLQSNYLFGAVGTGLNAQAQLIFKRLNSPFSTHEKYHFGPVKEKTLPQTIKLLSQKTDSIGRASFNLELDKLDHVKHPLSARLHVNVSDVDGRVVSSSKTVPIVHQNLWLGILSPKTVAADSGSQFDIIAVNSKGEQLEEQLIEYRLVEEISDYQWYQDEENGEWLYRQQTKDKLVKNGFTHLVSAKAFNLAIPDDIGRYRLEVFDKKQRAFSSAVVQVGWQAQGPQGVLPDRLEVSSDQESYQLGNEVHIQVKAPFSGHGELVIANDRILSVKPFELKDGKAILKVKVEKQWGAGVYALVTAFRPDRKRVKLGPNRAIGLKWLGLDSKPQQLSIRFEAPEKVRPRQTLPVILKVSGQQAGGEVKLTLAAVDEGVLKLTEYQTPDPLSYYFSQRRLGVDVRDLYGALIDGHVGVPGKVRSGAGAGGMQAMPNSHVKIVSLFSNIVTVDDNGEVSVALDIPDFNGRLRLMAVAWNEKKLGSASSSMIVQDPIVIAPSLPRFMSVGDKSQASILFHNVDAPSGMYYLSWENTGNINVADATSTRTISLDKGTQKLIHLPVEALGIGDGKLSLKLEGPEGILLEKTIEIGVRVAWLPQTQRMMGVIASEKNIQLAQKSTQQLFPGTITGSLTLNSQPDLDVPGLLKELDLYPHGCLEQVTSRAFPLLDLQVLKQQWDYKTDTPVSKRLDKAVDLIIQKQRYDGSFALWNSDGNSEQWLSMYAIDFLLQAKRGGVEVPQSAWESALKWLKEQVVYPELRDLNQSNAQMYGLYILADLGERPIKTARYLIDELKQLSIKKIKASPISLAQLGAALTLLGEPQRAESAFKIADKQKRYRSPRDYGSALRDQAARIFLQAKVKGKADVSAEQVAKLSRSMAEKKRLSTQEQAWLVRVAAQISSSGEELKLSLNNKSLSSKKQPISMVLDEQQLLNPLLLNNLGNNQAWYSLTISGSPTKAPEKISKGFEISQQWFDQEGNEIDPLKLQQGQLLVAVIKAKITSKEIPHQLLIVAPLAAGLEIENEQMSHSLSTSDMPWLDGLSELQYSAALDDRFVAALDTTAKIKQITIAYLARVVTPGEYQQPPVTIEDMYKPYYHGRSESSWVKILDFSK